MGLYQDSSCEASGCEDCVLVEVNACRYSWNCGAEQSAERRLRRLADEGFRDASVAIAESECRKAQRYLRSGKLRLATAHCNRATEVFQWLLRQDDYLPRRPRSGLAVARLLRVQILLAQHVTTRYAVRFVGLTGEDVEAMGYYDAFYNNDEREQYVDEAREFLSEAGAIEAVVPQVVACK